MSDTLASLAEDFVPTIRNSSTTCIPCGGAVRADADSTTQVQRGMAGGYAGHNEGGHIWGNNTKKWKGKEEYTGPTSTCKAVRIRSVYGRELLVVSQVLWSQPIQQVPEICPYYGDW